MTARERRQRLVPLAVGNDERVELAVAENGLHARKVKRGDDVVGDDQNLLGRRAIELGLVERAGPNVNGVAA